MEFRLPRNEGLFRRTYYSCQSPLCLLLCVCVFVVEWLFVYIAES